MPVVIFSLSSENYLLLAGNTKRGTSEIEKRRVYASHYLLLEKERLLNQQFA
jgi:hypothetical protein